MVRAGPGVRKCFPIHIGHNEEGKPPGFLDAVDRHDIRMRESSNGSSLPHEAFVECRHGKLRWQHFNGHTPVELYIVRQVDDPHSTTTQFALEGIAAREQLLER